MKRLKHLAFLSAISLLFSLPAFASHKNQHSVSIYDSVKVGGTQLKPGDYKLEWQGPGPTVQVAFMQNGNTLATDTTTAKTKALKEIVFAHQKEVLVFARAGK